MKDYGSGMLGLWVDGWWAVDDGMMRYYLYMG